MTDKSKYLWSIIAVLVFCLTATIHRIHNIEHPKVDYNKQVEAVIEVAKSKIAAIQQRNTFMQDSLTKVIINRSGEEKTLSEAIKTNTKHYEKIFHAIDTLNLDSSIQLRASQRKHFRRTYGQ